MTKEEAIEDLLRYYTGEFTDMAIKALKQEPCEDAVSRKDMYFKLTNGAYPNETIEQFIDRLVKELEAMPPVTPTRKKGKWPEGATNGDMIKAMFPDELLTSITSTLWWGDNMSFNKKWWNAPYKAKSEDKNEDNNL